MVRNCAFFEPFGTGVPYRIALAECRDPLADVKQAWTEADQALWAGVLNFWFLGRVLDKVRR